MSERDLYQQIIEYLSLRGCYVWRNSTGARGKYRFGKKGGADILGVTPRGRAIAVECKSDTGELSLDQEVFLVEFKERGAITIVARSLDDVITAYGQPC